MESSRKATVRLAVPLASALVAGLTVLILRSGHDEDRVARSECSAVPEPARSEMQSAQTPPTDTARISSQNQSVAPPKNELPRRALVLPSEPHISARLEPLIGSSEDGYLARMSALRSIGKGLSSSEMAAIYQFLDGHQPPRSIDAEEYHALRNELLNLLRDQKPFPQHLASNLVIMYRDRSHDPVWRDYCIQHLAQIYPQTAAPEQASSRATMWAATDETDTTIAGTALIGLARNVEQPGFNRNQIARKALLYATDSDTDDMTRLTSIQVCVLLKDDRVLPVARELVPSNAAATLRMSAIAAIGTLGASSDHDLLNQYATATDVRLRTAATSALKRLSDGG